VKKWHKNATKVTLFQKVGVRPQKCTAISQRKHRRGVDFTIFGKKWSFNRKNAKIAKLIRLN
jgi:hypothetical protein